MADKWKVIYYETQQKNAPVKEFISSLETRQKAKVMAFITLLQEQGANLPRPYADLLKDGIHELRIKLTGEQYRILYFFCYQKYIVLTNVFTKTTATVPEVEIHKANECRRDFLSRIQPRDLEELECRHSPIICRKN